MRIAPLDPPYAPEVQADFDAIMPPGAPPLVLFRVVARQPRLLHKLRGGSLLDRGAIGRRERELVILRACARAGAEYEWGVHVAAFAARVGLEPAVIEATVTRAADDPAWASGDALLVQLVDQLHERADVDEALWARLSAAFDPAQCLELVMLAGQYRMIGGLVRTLRLPPEPGAPRFPVAR